MRGWGGAVQHKGLNIEEMEGRKWRRNHAGGN